MNTKQIINLYENLKNNDLYKKLNLEEDKQQLLENLNKKSKIKIAVIGEFNVGKSTLINSIIKKDILPQSKIPTTKQITLLKESNNEYVKSDQKLPLNKENLKIINKTFPTNIEIGIKNLEYEIYDTPGINDGKIEEEMILNLLEKVDIILFVLKEAINYTELEFLNKVISKKKINKILFIQNFADRENIEIKKQKTIEILKEKFYLDLSQNIYTYSAKEAMNNSAQSEELLKRIRKFIKEIEDEIEQQKLDYILKTNVKNSILKIETALDAINNETDKYNQTIQKINQEILDFNKQIEKEVKNFTKEFELAKRGFKSDIRNSFEKIKQQIEAEFTISNIPNLETEHYLENKIKELIEYHINIDFKTFTSKLVKTFETLDTKIDPIYKEKNIIISQLVTNNYAPTIVKGIAIAGGIAGAVIYGPTILTIGASGITISAIASGVSGVANAIGAAQIAGIANGVSGTINTAVLLTTQAIKILSEVVKFVIEKLIILASEIEKIMELEKYKTNVISQLNDIRNKMIRDVEIDINPDIYIKAYINEKFPQKNELEKKELLLKNEVKKYLSNKNIDKNELEYLYKQFQEVINAK